MNVLRRRPRDAGMFRATVLSLCLAAPLASASDYIVSPDFANRWPTNTSEVSNVPWLTNTAWQVTCFYQGGPTGASSSPSGGGFKLASYSFGQPIESLKPDFNIGGVIVPPVGVDPARKPTIYPSHAAFYVPSRGRVIAADYGSVRVDWLHFGGSTNTRVYMISAVPAKEPARLFWTEPPYHAPAVDLTGKHATVHTNSAIPWGFLNSVSNDVGGMDYTVTGGVRVVTAGAQKEMRAAINQNGFFILEYFETGAKLQHVGIEIVEVLAPQILTQDVELGDRLHPVNNQWDVDGLIAQVSVGLAEKRAYQHHTAAGNSGQEKWVFATAPTVGEPYNLEVYWKHKGIMGVEWPYERDWYDVRWPDEPQLYVRDAGLTAGGPSVLIPGDLQVGLPGFPNPVVFQAPHDHAGFAVDNRSFSTACPGKALLAFRAYDAVWFRAVESVDHADRDHFDLAAIDGPIAAELTFTNAEYGTAWMDFPGFVCPNAGDSDRYNPGYYDYPTPDTPDAVSTIYPVNRDPGKELEVWWANPLLLTNPVAMPAPVYFPSMVKRYHAVWPTNATVLPIAGNNTNPAKMLTATKYANARVYVQNDADSLGYNPNEEHALIDAGAVYPIRDDLNVTGGDGYTSDPYVLIEYENGERGGQPDMRAFRVVVTNDAYPWLESSLTAGTPIQPPLPFSKLPKAMGSYNDVDKGAQAWRDRNLDYWAHAAGRDGISTTDIEMRFYYPMQASFWFPSLAMQPSVGTELAWFPARDDAGWPSSGAPTNFTYTVRWPDNPPTLKLVDTLYKPRDRMPDLSNQKSVSIVYDQSVANGRKKTVVLVDPTIAQANGADSSTWATVWKGLKEEAEKNPFDGNWYFPDLPPHLSKRLFYDPNAAAKSQLGFRGQFVDMLTGDDYLLLNRLSETNKVWVKELAPDGSTWESSWDSIIDGLASDIVEIEITTRAVVLRNSAGQTETVYYETSPAADSFALSTAPAGGTGFVTIAINNCTNLVEPADPISLYVIYVTNEMAQGSLVAVAPDNPFHEKITMRQTLDYGGAPEQYEFQWQRKSRLTDPDPLINDYWKLERGMDELTIGGPGLLTLQDNYFRCRFRATDTDFPLGTDAWSAFTDWQLAEGWIKRVLAGIDPFEQRVKDLLNNPAYTIVSMIQQAGPRWEGDVPLNLDHVNEYGLIEIYETVLNRGRILSIDADIRDGGANQALMLAVSRINELYMLLGNEAFADAVDPTIAFGTDDIEYGAEATSLFCFMNQEPSLLDEELALLRGRADAGTPVDQAPLYNRLPWNFTRSITGGEVAYALNYAIADQDTEDTNGDNVPDSPDGVLDETDAAKMYPQGHGDAWGHYLTAIKGYYTLLNHINYTWEPLAEDVLLGGSLAVHVDFTDEQKFAAAAAARARTGVELVKRTHRSLYSRDTQRVGDMYRDNDTNRAWSATEWGCRAGMGAYFDWLTGNSMLPAEDANPAHTGVDIIDRRSVTELGEVASSCIAIQQQLDTADAGLNPLGLSDNAVAFDISPTEIDDGHTHFEQVCARAERALNNAVRVFDHAQGCTLRLRQQAESLEAFEDAIEDGELDYERRLIAIYGYPYPEDIGPGKTYPQGYAGPDLYHYQYIDYDELVGYPPPAAWSNVTLTVTNLEYSAESEDYSNEDVRSVIFSIAGDGLLTKPKDWGRRRAQGELQFAYGAFLRCYHELIKTLDDTLALGRSIADAYDSLAGSIDTADDRYDQVRDRILIQQRLAVSIAVSEALGTWFQFGIDELTDTTDALAEYFPKVVGISNDTTSSGRGSLKLTTAQWIRVLRFGAAVSANAGTAMGASSDWLDYDTALDQLEWDRDDGADAMRADIEALTNQQKAKLAAVQIQLHELGQAQERYRALIAQGERILVERRSGRVRAAARIQKARYNDMAFRLFRDDALQKYDAAFDLAARYVYLAAKAYDYETALLDSDRAGTPGSDFMAQIARTRSLGRVVNGAPQPGGYSGDPGLADILYRLETNWEVLNGRLGFNNPETETSRFSLRTECLRITALEESDATWRRYLWSCRCDNLNGLPEFRRHCLPFGDEAAVEPGLVIPFSTVVTFGRNLFGHPLAGGDNAYDASHFATKIRSVGVWFREYNASGEFLANEPRVYLVPVGQDVMRSPSGSLGDLRAWAVEDQAIPIPYPIGNGDLDRTDWLATDDTLGGGFARIRKYASLRAYHDSGVFDPSETCSNSRLVGRSVWNTQWYLIIPAGTLHAAREQGLHWFIDGPNGDDGVKDIKIFFQTYSMSGN
jgi:hypothetical protein